MKTMFTKKYENRFNLNKEAGSLIHSFGVGYSIIDEYGREVNAFEKEKEFNRLIEKFRYRQFLIQKLKLAYNKEFEFKEDNVLFIDNKPINEIYWDLPKNENEVSLYFDYITSKYKLEILSNSNNIEEVFPYDENDDLP
jgi:hypothetical protein